MWIKEPTKDFRQQESSISNLNFLYNEDKFYFMDNHLAAAWCWFNKLNAQNSYNFFHIDQHEDLLFDAPFESYSCILDNPKLSLEHYISLKYTQSGSGFRMQTFRYDNYILQAFRLYPNWFKLCYFACPDSVHDKNLNIQYNPSCFELVDNISYWVHDGKGKPYSIPEKNNKWILNLDIDYFFKEDQYQMFTDDYIKLMCKDILKGIDDIEVITIALSPECCGGWDKSIRVANLISQELDLDFSL